MRKTLQAFLILSIVTIACKDKSTTNASAESESSIVEQILKDNNSIFRGIDLSATHDSVKKAEATTPTLEEANYILYQFKNDSNLNYTVGYNFDEYGLTDVTCDMFLKNEEQGTQTFNELKAHFNQKYGESVSEKGFWVWSTITNDKKQVKLQLYPDMSENNKTPKITLSIYAEPSI